MSNKAYFNEDIKPVIIQELQNVQTEVYIAVAWFNDSNIFETLVDLAVKGVKVELLISNDPANFESENSLDFQRLIDNGGFVNRLVNPNIFMHNKFCIIDNHTIITGSYNWTFGAYYKNLENIVIIENDIKLCEKFKQEYNRILDTYFAHLKEADEILEKLQNMIQDYRDNIKLNRFIPENIMSKLRGGAGNFLTDSNIKLEKYEENDTNIYIEKRSIDKEKWWEQLSSQWKLFLADKILPFGRNSISPTEDALEHLINLESISCANYYLKGSWDKTKNAYDITYYIKNLDGIENFYNLKHLDCSGNNLESKSIGNVNYLKKLQTLNLENNNLSFLPLNYALENLIELNISKNKFNSLDFSLNTTNLQILICHSNPISGLQGIEKLQRLRILYIDKKLYDLSYVLSKLNDLGFEKRDYQEGEVIKLER